jgi:hypothetical protein
MKTTLLCLMILVLVVGVFIWVRDDTKGKSENYDYVTRDLPTSPEVQMIEGRPNFDVVDRESGRQLIRSGDIALGAGFGVGEGTVGFGRFGSSFMA